MNFTLKEIDVLLTLLSRVPWREHFATAERANAKLERRLRELLKGRKYRARRAL